MSQFQTLFSIIKHKLLASIGENIEYLKTLGKYKLKLKLDSLSLDLNDFDEEDK